MTNRLKGKKILIIPGLLLLLVLRLPATEAGGIPLRRNMTPSTNLILNTGAIPSASPELNDCTSLQPDTISSRALRQTLDSLRNAIHRPVTDTIRSTGGRPMADSLRSAGTLTKADTTITSGMLLNQDSLSLSGEIVQPDFLTLDGDTLRSDSLKASGQVIKPKTSAEAAEIHSPRKASLYSAMLPGLGQAYNKKYWKIPIIYGGFGALGYFIGWNNRNYKQANRAYSDLTDDDPETDSFMKLEQIIYYDLSKASDVASLKQGLLSSQDYFRRNRDLLIILTAAFYGLNIIDASVDAHFFNFDISDDLTLNWEPVLRHDMNQNIFCVNCTFRF